MSKEQEKKRIKEKIQFKQRELLDSINTVKLSEQGVNLAVAKSKVNRARQSLTEFMSNNTLPPGIKQSFAEMLQQEVETAEKGYAKLEKDYNETKNEADSTINEANKNLGTLEKMMFALNKISMGFFSTNFFNKKDGFVGSSLNFD